MRGGGADTHEIVWSDVLDQLINGESLDRATARLVMNEVLNGRATSAQLAALLCVLRSRGETTNEMAGFVDAMVEASITVPLPPDLKARAVDTCGTGGDNSGTINISTAAAFVVAAAGVPVCKHGNRASTSKSGSADVLEALGVAVDLDAHGVARCVERVGLGFCLAPRFHPAMRHAGATRKELGVRTAFNFLGPMVNPGRVGRQVIGVSEPRQAETLLAVLADAGASHSMVVNGNDGLDELTTCATSTVREWRDGSVRTYEVQPEQFGLARAEIADLLGDGPETNAVMIRRILEGESGPKSDVVALNAGAALVVGGEVATIEEGVIRCQSLLRDGAGARLLDALIQESTAVAQERH